MSEIDEKELENREKSCVQMTNDDQSQERKKRDRRTNFEVLLPLSPASFDADATFEPSIDMLVNDFDDEVTLNEEEAQEDQLDPADEIATLQEEGDMPLEELLAKYGSAFATPATAPKPRKRKVDKRVGSSSKKLKEMEQTTEEISEASTSSICADIAESVDEQTTVADENESMVADNEAVNGLQQTEEYSEEFNESATVEKLRPLRSHLLELYPENCYNISGEGAVLDVLDDDEIEDDEEENEETITKTMVGANYQAVIPEGLSQYGDILPYENEDKLIWEPSQVSEREVEEYLVKARDIKPSMVNDEQLAKDLEDIEAANKDDVDDKKRTLSQESDSNAAVESTLSETETSGVIKDNEQNLHLLVQCGYDFKEALRRKRIYAVPPGSMSLWSEEECQKFEEGIQTYGKDFLKIRQNLVRTRSLTEIVQFYYMWKKSERGDINFAKSDTVDHMDIYLNEGGDFGNNSANVSNTNSTSSSATCAAAAPLVNSFAARRSSTGQSNAKSFSIMTGNNNTNSTVVSNHNQALNNVNNSSSSQANKLQGRRKTANSSLLPSNTETCLSNLSSSVSCGK